MVNNDIKVIKKLYGEKIAQLCDHKLGVIKDKPGALVKIISEIFAPNKFLYDDLDEIDQINAFIDIMKSKFRMMYPEESIGKKVVDGTPEELFRRAGYDLYKCETEEDIQKFRRYYSLTEGEKDVSERSIEECMMFREYIEEGGKIDEYPYGIPGYRGEEICTFSGGRLDTDYVFFAVKYDADFIDRSENPRRQDEYGTSVISIQFSRDESNALSIKNRYNHTVEDPDYTFSNDLENIYPGLTDSFEKYYSLREKTIASELYLPDYIKANDGKLYKFNYEINGIFYCPGNIIIDDGEVVNLNKDGSERYILADYFIIDTKDKKIYNYDKSILDSFPQAFSDSIKKFEVEKENDKKNIKVIYEDETREADIISLNKYGGIAGAKLHTKIIGDNFARFNTDMISISIDNAIEIGNDFMGKNIRLEEISFNMAERIGDNFLVKANLLSANFSKIEKVGANFLAASSINIINKNDYSDTISKRALS